MGRESEDLVYEEIGAEALSGAGDPPYRRNSSGETNAHSAKGCDKDAPENNRLRLVLTPHDEVHFRGQLVQVRGGRSRSAGERHAGISVTSFLVILRGDFVDVGEGLVRIYYDEVRCGYPRVWIVGAETSVEDGEDGVISGIYGGGSGGRYEVNEVARRDGVGGRHRRATSA